MLVQVSWLSARVVVAAAALALLAHALLLWLWLQESARPAPPLPPGERLSVQLHDPVPLLPTAEIAPPTETTTAQAPPARTEVPVAPTQTIVEPEISAPLVVDQHSERVAIDWQSAREQAARDQLGAPASRSRPSIGAPLPRLPGERADPWAAPLLTPSQRLQQIGQMRSQDQLVGGDGLHSLVAAGPMEQEINRRIQDLQSECHPTADGRLRCPRRR